jgi:hypothetical protein
VDQGYLFEQPDLPGAQSSALPAEEVKVAIAKHPLRWIKNKVSKFGRRHHVDGENVIFFRWIDSMERRQFSIV